MNGKKLKVLELFAGTRSIGKAFEEKGHEVFSVEWDEDFENIDLYADILSVSANDILSKFGHPDVIWASPDCTTFSIAAISHHRKRNPDTGNLDPVSDYAKFCDKVDQHVLQLIKDLDPILYFIENPRGGMRKMIWMKSLPRYTVTYCQYGDTRMKPTDIWTNHPNPQFKPICKNGDPCHVPAPRGSKTGTQGLKNSRERSVIPKLLCQHIVDICERYLLNQIEDCPLEYVWFDTMSDEEKAAHPEAETTGGYLKERTTADNARKWWAGLSADDRNIIFSLPNFDAAIFKEITGIDVDAE